MKDTIVDEVRRVRDAYAASFNYDLDAMFEDIKEQEKKSGWTFVSGVARQPGRSQSPLPSPPPIIGCDSANAPQAG